MKGKKIMNIVGLIYFYHKDAMRHNWRMRHMLATPGLIYGPNIPCPASVIFSHEGDG